MQTEINSPAGLAKFTCWWFDEITGDWDEGEIEISLNGNETALDVAAKLDLAYSGMNTTVWALPTKSDRIEDTIRFHFPDVEIPEMAPITGADFNNADFNNVLIAKINQMMKKLMIIEDTIRFHFPGRIEEIEHLRKDVEMPSIGSIRKADFNNVLIAKMESGGHLGVLIAVQSRFQD